MQDISREIIRLASQGDKLAFKEIYDRTSAFVYNVAYRVVNNKEDAEEITQDVFVKIFRKISGFRFDASLKTWIYRITVNTGLNFLKNKKKEKNNVPYEDVLEKKQINEPAAAQIHDQAREETIRSLLTLLNPDQRACVILRSIEGLSYQEIAESLNTKINTVRSRLKRARMVLLAKKNEVINR